MDIKYQNFIDSLDAESTIRIVKSLSKIGEYDYNNCNFSLVEEVVLSLNPNSLKSITTICNIMCRYAKFIDDNHLYRTVQDLDRKTIWLKAKTMGHKKFLSHKQFKEVYHNIGMYEEYNALYYQTLFWCLYEGIYNNDMSVLKNLRAKDIVGNEITLREDNGNTYKLIVPQQLADDLIELSSYDTWERKGRYETPVRIKIKGLYPDSCFKVEHRKEDSKTTYSFSYYQKLRKIAKEYLEYNLLPLQIYISGIMYRIRLQLEKHNISLEDAFAYQSRDRLVGDIISQELKRCNYVNIKTGNFREIVNGYIEVFEE